MDLDALVPDGIALGPGAQAAPGAKVLAGRAVEKPDLGNARSSGSCESNSIFRVVSVSTNKEVSGTPGPSPYTNSPDEPENVLKPVTLMRYTAPSRSR